MEDAFGFQSAGSDGVVRRNQVRGGSLQRARPVTMSKKANDKMDAEGVQATVKSDVDVGLLQEAYEAGQHKIELLLQVIKENETKFQLYEDVTQKCSDAYEDLKLKYEAENDAANTVMVKATQWYKENKKLKRKSTFMRNKLQTCNVDEATLAEVDQDSGPESHKEEESVDGFMADMKSRLGEVTAEKDQALKQVDKLKKRVEAETKKYKEEAFCHKQTQNELEYHRMMLNRMQKVSVMAVSEFDVMREKLAEKEAIASKAVNDILEVDRERKALKRTSAALLAKIAPDQQYLHALMDVEQLTTALEKVKSELEEKTSSEEEMGKNLESLRDKLKWTTDECMEAQDNEKRNTEKIQQLEKTIRDLTLQLEAKTPRKGPPPPPPPPPPMPAQQWSWNPLGLLMNAIGLSRTDTTKKKQNVAAPKDDLQKKAMDDMMQKIERGEFRLRPIGINTIADDDRESEESANPAIDEFRNVFGTLRKGGSMRNFKQAGPVVKQQNFTYSLRSKERGPLPSFVQEKKSLTPELESKLVKRRQAISVVVEEDADE